MRRGGRKRRRPNRSAPGAGDRAVPSPGGGPASPGGREERSPHPPTSGPRQPAAAASAWTKSASSSAGSSIPTETRIRASVMPAASRSTGDREA